MRLKDKIVTPKECVAESRILEKVLRHALYRDSYDRFGNGGAVDVSKNLREAYFELFADFVDKNSIHYYSFRGDLSLGDLEKETSICFHGRDGRGVNFALDYLPHGVDLEISAYSFNGAEKGVGIAEIGLFMTELDEGGNLRTSLRVGDNFAYYSGYCANNSISGMIDRVQESKVIPSIPLETLENLKRWKEYTGKERMSRKNKS